MSLRSKFSINNNCSRKHEKMVAAFALVAISGFFLLAWSFNNGVLDAQKMFGICGIQQRYHVPCPACGMTTAVCSFVAGDISHAFYLQPAAAVLCMLFVFIWLCSILIILGVDLRFIYCRLLAIPIRYVILIVIIIMLGGWAVTLSRALAKI